MNLELDLALKDLMRAEKKPVITHQTSLWRFKSQEDIDAINAELWRHRTELLDVDV